MTFVVLKHIDGEIRIYWRTEAGMVEFITPKPAEYGNKINILDEHLVHNAGRFELYQGVTNDDEYNFYIHIPYSMREAIMDWIGENVRSPWWMRLENILKTCDDGIYRMLLYLSTDDLIKTKLTWSEYVVKERHGRSYAEK